MSWILSVGKMDNLLKAMAEYQGNTEETVNSVLHDAATIQLIQDSIRQLMPRSNVTWNGKLPHAKDSKKSLRDRKENLSITIHTSSDYYYLCFPDNGRTSNGNEQFFARGAEAVQDDIIERCIAKLTNKFEEGV